MSAITQAIASFLDAFFVLMSVSEIRYGLELVCAAALINLLKQRKAALIYLTIGLILLIIGFNKTGVTDLILLAIDKDPLKHCKASTLFYHELNFPDALLGLSFLVLPPLIARKRQNNVDLIIILSALSSLAPFLWPIALFLAHQKQSSMYTSQKWLSPRTKKIIHLATIISCIVAAICGLIYILFGRCLFENHLMAI
jgi:hypothetical protein